MRSTSKMRWNVSSAAVPALFLVAIALDGRPAAAPSAQGAAQREPLVIVRSAAAVWPHAHVARPSRRLRGECG